ncbi:MAG: NUDIX domain-containing protein [Chloroflexota bacterium]|nr:NUDIX domain-containing protein [Chloroflexota bacterium]
MDYHLLQAQAEADGRQCVVAGLILDSSGRAFVHRRSWSREFLPGGWDVAGGHVDPGETLLEALEREVWEETGWRVVGSPQLAYVADWSIDETDPGSGRREFDFLVDVAGDLAQPRLERPQHIEFRWIGFDEIGVLDENGGRDHGIVRHQVELALRSTAPGQLQLPHAVILMEREAANEVEALRARWDPAMADQIGAHITLAYPEETRGVDDLRERLARAIARVAQFGLALGDIEQEDDIFFRVRDPEEGCRRLRAEIVGPDGPAITPHVTIVNPRTTNRADQAWAAMKGTVIDAELTVDSVAVVAFDGRRWRTVARFPLAS